MNYQPIIELVKQAGAIVFDKTLRASVEMKGEADFVTAVDLRISQFVKEELQQLTPQIGFMSEEEKGEIAPERWVLDPIDGTTNLVYDYQMSSVSLAHVRDNTVLFGVVYNPYNHDLFIAERGKGATLNGAPLPPAPDRELKDCLIEFGAGSTKKQYADLSFALAKEVFQNCLDLRRICSSALAICYVAAGRLNGYFERSLKPWDYAAATLILEECGGKSLNWRGTSPSLEAPDSFVCGTEKALAFLLQAIQNIEK